MSQRNPNNQRYQQQEKHSGSSRKSASSAKPKSKAANSVVMGSAKKTKTKADKKAEEKEQRAKDRERERKYYTPPTKKFKRLKALWWVCLVVAVTCVLISWFGREYLPDAVSKVALVFSYVSIGAALFLDLVLMRKERRRYAAEMEQSKTKENRAAQREEKRRAREAEKKGGGTESKDAAAKEEAAQDAQAGGVKSKLLGFAGLSGKKLTGKADLEAAERLIESEKAAEKNEKDSNKAS